MLPAYSGLYEPHPLLIPAPPIDVAYDALVPRAVPPPTMEEIKYKEVPSVWERSGEVSFTVHHCKGVLIVAWNASCRCRRWRKNSGSYRYSPSCRRRRRSRPCRLPTHCFRSFSSIVGGLGAGAQRDGAAANSAPRCNSAKSILQRRSRRRTTRSFAPSWRD